MPPVAPRLEPSLLAVAEPAAVPTGSGSLDEPQLVDLSALRELVTLTLEALRRRARSAGLAFVLVLGGILGITSLFPRSYHTQTRILAQRNLVMPALGNPRRAVPIDSDTPTRAVSETILTRDNFTALIQKVDLFERWKSERAPIQRLKDRLWLALFRPQTEAQKLDALIGVLETHFHVTTDDSSVTIGVDWANAETAFELVQQAQANFLEARHATEVSTIGETISILEAHAADSRATMEQTFDQIEKARISVAEERRSPSTHGAVRRAGGVPRDEEFQATLVDLKAKLERKRQQISEMDESRVREMNRLSAELVQQRAIYAPAHPAILQTEQSLRTLETEPAELTRLRAQERELASQYREAEGLLHDAKSELTPRARPQPAPVAHSGEGNRDEEDTRVEYPKARLHIAADNYEDLLRRIDAARIELDTAQAAFKYRYRVIQPAEVPNKAEKPKLPIVVAEALFAALLAAMGTALALDLRGGRIHAGWQVEKRLKVPVLVELRPE